MVCWGLSEVVYRSLAIVTWCMHQLLAVIWHVGVVGGGDGA